MELIKKQMPCQWGSSFGPYPSISVALAIGYAALQGVIWRVYGGAVGIENQQKALAQSALHYQSVQRRLEDELRRTYQKKLRSLLATLDDRFGARYRGGWDWARLKRFGDWTRMQDDIKAAFRELHDDLTEALRKYNTALAKEAYERYLWEARQATREAEKQLAQDLAEEEAKALEAYAETIGRHYAKSLGEGLLARRKDLERTLRGELIQGTGPEDTWEAVKDRLGIKRGQRPPLGNVAQSSLGDTVTFARERARRKVDKENLIHRELWQNVLDGHEICAYCSPLHGLLFPEETSKKIAAMGLPKRWWKTHRPPLHPNCVLQGTTVDTKQGVRFIEEIAVGDEVKRRGGRYSRVLEVFRRKYEGDFVVLAVREQTLYLTPDHRVLVGGRQWKRAMDLRVGDSVTTVRKEFPPQLWPVHGKEYATGLRGVVYNLRMERSPTYFANGILVHNCYCYIMPVVTGKATRAPFTGFRSSQDYYGEEAIAPAEAPEGALTLAKRQEEVLEDLSQQAGFPLRLVLFTKRPEKR